MPEIEIDYARVEAVAKVFGTYSECAALLGISEAVIRRLAANDQKFIEAWQRGHELCKLDVRRTMWRHAKGFGPAAVNATIHLAKHILGETEKSLVEVSGTIQHELVHRQQADLLVAGVDSRCLTVQEAAELQDLCEALDQAGDLRKLGSAKRTRMLALVGKGAGDNIIDGEFTEVKPSLPAPVEGKE